MSETARAALLDKYTRLLALRRAHARGEPVDASSVRALAQTCPGALFELDRAPLATLEARLDALRDGALPEWAEVSHGYHEVMVIALAVRRAAGRDRDAARAAVALAGSNGHWALGPHHLKSLMNPPEGKLSVWAVSHLSEVMGLPTDEVRRRLYGHLMGRW